MENTIVQPEKVSPKHVFLHLFVIIMLYASTVNFVTLLFQYINYWVADTLSKTSNTFLYNAEIIKFGLAALIIIFPVFILVSRFLNNSYFKNPAIREMRVRKWLIYFTLFVAALIIIGDLVSIILTFLNGEMTLRFILKALSILLVTGLIFFYYLRDLKNETSARGIKVFVWAVIAMVAAVIVTGFFVVGSPSTSRARRFDNTRVYDLQALQGQITYYWQSKAKLPAVTNELTDSISGFKAPVDPENGASYVYEATGTTTFKLCATFNLKSEGADANSNYAYPVGGTMDNWTHEAGYVCYERVIDPELYKQFEKVR
jgi:hypothetical protein